MTGKEIAVVIGLTFCIVSCGGGSGGGGTPTGPTTSNSFQITWPARSRGTLTALASALSAQVVFHSADAKGQDVIAKIDRDSTKVSGYTGSYTLTTPVVVQGKTLTATFYAGAGESGAVVGTATANVGGTSTLLSLTNLQLAGTIATVTANSATMLTTAGPLQLTFSAQDKNKNPVVVSAGSGIWSLTNGSSISLTKDGIATPLAAGTSNFSVNVDGIVAKSTVVVNTPTTKTGSPLATSAWPKFHHDNMGTGLGAASGAAGKLRWKFTTGYYVRSSAAIGPDGTVYFGSDDQAIYALSSTGIEKWHYLTGGVIYSSPAIASNGTVYEGSDDDYLYALNSTGSLKWKFRTTDRVRSSPAIGSDGTVYVGSNDHFLYAINADGSLKWRYQTGGVVGSSPAIASDGTIYVGCADDNLYAITSAGALKWKYTMGGIVDFSSPAIGKDGTVYIGNFDHNLYAITSAGALKWKFANIVGIESSPAVGSDGTIYLGGNDYYLYAINPNGTQKWSYQTGNYFYSSPAIGSDGSIYVGNGDGNLYAFTSGGVLKWQYPTISEIQASPAIGPDGAVYVGSVDNNFYAIK